MLTRYQLPPSLRSSAVTRGRLFNLAAARSIRSAASLCISPGSIVLASRISRSNGRLRIPGARSARRSQITASVGGAHRPRGSSAYYAAAQQNRHTAAAVTADWLNELRSWASEAIDVLAEASYTCRRGDSTPTDEERTIIHRCRYQLSALVDRGRFLLPNERETEFARLATRSYTPPCVVASPAPLAG